MQFKHFVFSDLKQLELMGLEKRAPDIYLVVVVISIGPIVKIGASFIERVAA